MKRPTPCRKKKCVYEGVYSCLLFHMQYPFFLRLDFASRCSRSIHRSKTQTHHRFVVATSRPSVCHQQRLSFEESNLFFYSLLNAYCSMYARCACKQSFTCKAQRRGYRDSICFVCVNRPRGFTTTFLTLQHLRLAVQHTLYIHNHPCNSVRKYFAIPTNTNFGQQTMAFRRCAASDAAAKHDLSNIRRCAVTISTERTTTTCACACNEPHKHYFAVQNMTAP